MISIRSSSRQEDRVKAAAIFLVLLAFASVLHAQTFRTSIVFYAEPEVDGGLWPTLFESLHQDLADEARELPQGVLLDPDPALLLGRDLHPGDEFPHLIEVRLLGRCDVLPQADHHLRPGPLGWVLQVSGVIQPFIFVDCTRVAQVVGPAVLRLDKEARERAMTHAIAHVVIHEWVHIETQSSSHSQRGVTQASLSAKELIASPRKDPYFLAQSRITVGLAVREIRPSGRAERPDQSRTTGTISGCSSHSQRFRSNPIDGFADR